MYKKKTAITKQNVRNRMKWWKKCRLKMPTIANVSQKLFLLTKFMFYSHKELFLFYEEAIVIKTDRGYVQIKVIRQAFHGSFLIKISSAQFFKLFSPFDWNIWKKISSLQINMYWYVPINWVFFWKCPWPL